MGVSQGAIALAAFLALTSGVQGEPDRFMRAVGFALTGNADTELKAIDRTDCVFAIGADVFHLNNVYTDRIAAHLMGQVTIQGEGKLWVRVELHGDPFIYEHGEQTFKDHTLELSTEDQDRVSRAWEYIYGRFGCEGKESPF
jgi:hypothetical protein